MSAEVTDVSSIQDEDLLRRMWQQTEDFGRKKEIRARMYKLREQRLKEFYTTGEVLSDVLSTSTSSLDEGRKNVSSSSLKSSQSSSQLISKSSSYTSNSSGGGYSITHADSLADEGFLTLKTKEIRDSESPTRDFHHRQERNAKNESSSCSAEAGESYWRIVQESSSGAFESTSKTGEGGDIVVHTTGRNESRNLAGDSKQEVFTTSNQATSSEHTLHKPQPSSGIEVDVTVDKSLILTSNGEDIGARKVSSSAEISSTSSASCSGSGSHQFQQNEKISAFTSSTVKSNESSQAISGSENTNVAVSESAKFSSSTSATQDITSSSAAATTQINTNHTSKHRITQRSQTGELLSKTLQSSNGTSDIKSTAVDQSLSTVAFTNNSLANDGSSSSTKVAEQSKTSELQKLDSFSSTQNAALDSTPVNIGDTHDSRKWTVVSSDKSHNVNNATDEFVFCSGRATDDKKDNIKFVQHEQTSPVVNLHGFREPVDATTKTAEEKTSTTTKKDKEDLQNLVSEATEMPKRGVSTEDKTAGKDGQYVTTYQEAYSNKRISVDLSPSHEAFARSLRASPERATPSSSTRSSSKASLDRCSPDRFNKSPTRSYRNKTSLDNTLATGRTSPDKTPRSKTPPTRVNPEKITYSASPRHSSPDKNLVHRSSTSRVSPEKTTRYPDVTSPGRTSPEKITKSPYTPLRESPEKTGKSSATERRKSLETATKSPESDGSSSLASPHKRTRPSHAEITSPSETYPDKLRQDETHNVPERKISSRDKPRDITNSHSSERKTSDSTKSFSSVPNRDSNVKSKTTKEKRKLSSGISRATTKKRSSTPGVSPNHSPTRDEETRLTERQSRQRFRGSSSHSSSDSGDSDADVKPTKLQNEVETGHDISKTAVHTESIGSETNIQRTGFEKSNAESYTTGEKIAAVSSNETEKKKFEQMRQEETSFEDSPLCKDDEATEIDSEQCLDSITTKSSLLSTTDRAPDKSSNITSVPRKFSSEDTFNVKKIKSTGSPSITSKTTLNKSSERSPSPPKIRPDGVGNKILPPSQESSYSSPSSSPSAMSPTTHTGSPKSALNRLPRDKSPEYSSEGSVANELYPKLSTTDKPKEMISSVKNPRAVRKDSPDSSPDRGNFTPIKCFRTTPEIRPSTLEFAHPEKQGSFKVSPEKTKSPTRSFKKEPLDCVTTKLESAIEEAVKPLTETSTKMEPVFLTNADFKKSPERPNTSPAFEIDHLSATSTKMETNIFNTVPLAPKDASPDAIKGRSFEGECKADQKTEYPSRKRTTDDQTKTHQKYLDTTTTSCTSKQVISGYTFGEPHKLSDKPEESSSEDSCYDGKHSPVSARKSTTQEHEVDRNTVQENTEPKSSSTSPRSSSPEKSSATHTSKISVKLASHKKYSPQDRKVKSTSYNPSPSTVHQNSRYQQRSDSSPERESLAKRTAPKSCPSQKSKYTESSKDTATSSRIIDTSSTTDKSTGKKSDLSFPFSSQSPENLKIVSQSRRDNPESKVLESKSGHRVPSRDEITAHKPNRPSSKSSHTPHSSPERTSPNITARKKYDSSPDSRQLTTPSPKRLNDREIHPNTVAKSPERSPSSSPERHRSPEKKEIAIKPTIKHVSALQEKNSTLSSSGKRSRIPSSFVRDRANQSPERSSDTLTKCNEIIARPRQSPVHPIKKSTSPYYSTAKTNQLPARPSEQTTRINQPSSRVSQSPTRSPPSSSGHKYESVKPKRSGSENVPVKSAFVRTSSKPQNRTPLPRSPKVPGHIPDRYSKHGSPSKQCTRVSPSQKIYPATKDSKQDKPGEAEEEGSTDRSSTVSSPETVKTAGDSTAIDAALFADTEVIGQKTTLAHKRTEMYIPQLTCDRDSVPSGDAQNDNPVSLSALRGTEEIETREIASSVTNSISWNRNAEDDIFEDKHKKVYCSQDYNVGDLRDETPPVEFLVEDDFPIDSQFQTHSTSGKPQNSAEDIGGVRQRSVTSRSKMTDINSASRYGRTTALTTKISIKPSTTQEPRRQKQVPHPSADEKRNTPTVQSKHRPRFGAAADIRIARSSSDKNVSRKQAPSLSDVQPRRQTSKPEMTVSRATISRNAQSARQQVTSVGTATTIRSTKIPTQSVRPTVNKVPCTTEQKRSKDAPKSAVITSAKNRTFVKHRGAEIRDTKQTRKDSPNEKSEKPNTSSSEDEQEVPETVTDEEKEPTFMRMVDDHDEIYIKELNKIKTEEEQYTAKLTATRTLEDRLLSPSRDVTGVVIQPIKSSRESSPEYPRGTIDNARKPRYADRISEPEDDDEAPRQYKEKTVFQKPTFLPEAVDEEYTYDDIESKREQVADTFQQNESSGYVISRAEQVTDLDEESDTDQTSKSVSVADRVSHFLETTRNVLNSIVPSVPGKPIDSSPASLDSPSTVRRARAMFETIATSQTSTNKDFSKVKDTTNVFETYHDGPKESKTSGRRRPDNERRSTNTSLFCEQQPPDRHDALNITLDTNNSVKRSLINEYPVDSDTNSPSYKESYPVQISEHAEISRTLPADTHIHRKSPSPERLGSREPTHTHPHIKSPTFPYAGSKKSVFPSSTNNMNYDTYTKVKHLKGNIPGTKQVVTQPGTSPNTDVKFDGQKLQSTDVPLIGESPHKNEQPVKEYSQQEPLSNKHSPWKTSRDISSEHNESSLSMSDSFSKKPHSVGYPDRTSGQGMDSKQKDSFSSRDECKHKKVEQEDAQPRKQPVREDFPEDALIQTFAKDTTTQRETLRQKDILNRPSVFEARPLGQKLASHAHHEKSKHSHESRRSGYAELHPSNDDILARDNVVYSTDTLTEKTEREVYPDQDIPQSIYTHYSVSAVKNDATSTQHYSSDVYPERMSSRIDNSHTPKDSTPRKEYPVEQDSEPSSGKYFPNRKYNYPKRETSPSQIQRVPKKEQTESIVPSKKTAIPGKYSKEPSPEETPLVRKHSSQKDTSPTRKESYPKGESPREVSATRHYSSLNETLLATRDSYPKGKSSRDSAQSINYSSPKDSSPERKESYPEVDSHGGSSPIRKHSSPKDTSPTRSNSYPKVESPRVSSPIRKHSSPKDTTPTRKDSYPRTESPREKSPTRRYPSPKDTSPTRKDSYPKMETPRDSSSTSKHSSSKDTSPTRRDSYPNVEYPRDSSPTAKTSPPKDTPPTRKDSYPKAESPRDSSPIRKHAPPKGTSPTRKDSYPKAESPRDSSPIRKHARPKGTSPTRKDSYPKVESTRDSSPARKHSSPKDTSPTRKDSISSRVTCNISAATIKRSSSNDESPKRKLSPPVGETPKEFSTTKQYSVPIDTALSRDYSLPTLKDRITDNRIPADGSPNSQDISPKRTSLTKIETRSVTLKKDFENSPCHPKEEPQPMDTGTIRSSGRFGVNLRRIGSTVGSTIQRRLSGESSRPVTTLNKKGDELRIDDIFDLELLESMLEKAVGYEQRRSIRAQIRIVRRLLAERSAVTVRAGAKPEQPFDRDLIQFVGDNQDGDWNRNSDTAVDSKMSLTRQEPGGPDCLAFESQPYHDDDDDSCQKSSLPQKPCPETRRQHGSPDVQDSNPPAIRPETYSTFPRDSKAAPEKIPEWKSSPARKSSKSELSIELKPGAPSSVKSPIKKSSLGEPPREAFPTDSVTSSYGVGPTDENGRPLFGLSALRRRQSTNNNIQIPQDGVDSSPASELEPEDKPQEEENKRSEICDSSGRPIFGGLRALKATTTTTTNRGSVSLQGGDNAPSTENGNVREQCVSSHLRELVTKHEQTSRGNAMSQPTAPRQKPRAKLRDSFVQRSQDSESEKHSAEEVTDKRIISQRVNSLRAIIQKHEKIAQDETRSDRVPSSDGDIPDAGDIDISSRPGILKKQHGSDRVVTESTSTSNTTVISSRGILKPDGTVSLKRDIIQGETVSRLGEEPVTRITRTQYTYNTPDNKSTAVSSYDFDCSDAARESSTSSRRSSSGKTPSPERGHRDSDVKLSSITTPSVTSSNSFRRSKISEDDGSKYENISSTATRDDISRRSKLTTDRRAEDNKKFVSSATAVLSQQKVTDENNGILSCSSLQRENISNTEGETKSSTLRDGKYIGSTTTTIAQTAPVSMRDDFEDTRKTSTTGYGKYSSTKFTRSETGREVTNYFLDSERSRCSSESRRLLHDDDDDESDGYRYIPTSLTDSDTPRLSRRYSNEADTDGQVQRSEICYSSHTTVTQNHSGATTTVETTTSSRSSTPKLLSESVRRRSSAASDVDQDSSAIPSTGSSALSKVARGGSVRALSQKFQQAAGSTNVKKSVSVDIHSESTPSSVRRTSSAETEGKSFLTNQTRVTGVQDVITRMKNADTDVKAGESQEDAEARSLLNKFLGAQVMLQGMEPLMKASQSQSAALVSQVERQRVLTSQKTTTALTSSKDLEQDLEEIWDEKLLRELLDKCTDYEGRRKIRARLRVVMAEQKACASVVAAAMADEEAASEREQEETGDVLRHSVEQGHSESKETSSSTDGSTVTHTEVTTKTSSISTTSVGKGRVPKAPSGKAMSPFAKFQQLDRQSSSQSSPSSPKTPGGTTAAPLFKFTDPKLSRSASGVKDRLLFWCQSKTKEYKNIQIDNFSTSWSNGLAFCALIHHFLPDAFEYDSLRPEERRKNFELAFRIADEKAGIAPLLDVEDMVIMHKPDWKCVFTYVQSVYRRFKDQD